MKKLYNSLTDRMTAKWPYRIRLLLFLMLVSQVSLAQTIDFNEITQADQTDIGKVYTPGNFPFSMTNDTFNVPDFGNELTKGVSHTKIIKTEEGLEMDFESFFGNSTSPVFESLSSAVIEEETVMSTTVLDVNANDGAGGATDANVTYSLSGTDAADFSIDANSGVLTFTTIPDWSNPADADTDNIYELTVIATGTNTAATNQDITIFVFPKNGLTGPEIATQLGMDIDGEAASDNLGWSVSLSADGTTVAIGAINNDENGNQSGHVRIYRYNGSAWAQLGADINGEAANDNSGYSVSLSADGTTVAIGANRNDGNNGNSSGHVRIYRYTGSAWAQLGADIDGEAANDDSGWSVSLSANGAVVAIGAKSNHNSNGNFSGHVRIYRYNGSTWTQLGEDIDGEATEDDSGYSVSLSADGATVAIGAHKNDGINGNGEGVGNDYGHVRIYRYTGSAWVQLGADIDGEADGDQSGLSVSLSADGTTVAIGAPRNDATGTSSGHVRIYRYNGSAWLQVGADIDGEAERDQSGISVSLSADGNTVAIGAFANDGGGTASGHVRIYRYTGSAWAQVAADIDGEVAEDQSGYSVSLSADGTSVAIGAPYNDANGDNSGHVRIYSLAIPAPVFTSATTATFVENGTGTAYTATATTANTITYSLGTGNDESLFNIASGVLTFKTAPDFENPADANTDNAYVINMIASNGTNTTNQDVTITVTNINEAPAFTSTPVTSVNDNSSYRYYIHGSDDDEDDLTVTATTKPDWLTLSSLPAGALHTFAGTSTSGNNNGFATDARFNFPIDVALDADGNVFVVEENNNQIRKISTDGQVSTFAAGLNFPAGIAIDASDNVYVTDTHNHLIKKITKEGVVTTLASGINQPYGIAVDAQGVVYATSIIDHTIYKVSTSGQVTTLAGTGNFGTKDGTGTEAGFSYPSGLALDATGNIYVADWGNNRVRQITSAGVVTTVAGSNNQTSFNGPRGITVDADGIIYVTENPNTSGLIRKVQGGSVTTLASTLPSATNTLLTPEGLTVDKQGNLYVADVRNHSIKILPAQALPVLSGSAVGQKGTHDVTLKADDGNGGTAEQNFTITINDATDPVFTSATTANFAENSTGTAYTATATDANALTYSLGSGNDEALFDVAGGVVTFKTSPDFESPGDANKDNAYVINVTVDDGVNSVGQLVTITVMNVNEAPSFISSAVTSVDDNATYNYAIAADDRDGDNLTITAVTKPDWLTLTSTSGNEVTTLAGSGSASSTNGTGVQASFNQPEGIAVDAAGNMYVAELRGHVIRKITPNGEVTTLAGSGSAGSANGTGTEASFSTPRGVAVDVSGNVYVADFGNNLIRKITSAGVVTTFAGSGTSGSDNGPGTFASFNAPIGVAVDATNNVYVATFTGNLIRKISPAGVVSTLAGSGEYGNSNGNGTDASFFLPQNLAVDISGNVYVVGAHLVRKITPNGDVTTLAGSGAIGKVNGNGTNASFASSNGVSVDASGNVFIADLGNDLIRKITPNGDVTTLAGSGSKGSTNAHGLAASFNNPGGIVVDADGNLFVTEVDNHLIRKISTTSHLLSGDATGQTGTHDITLKADDGNGKTVEQNFTITVNDVTDPVFTSATTANFAENGTGTAYTVTATDINGLTYSLGTDNDESLFDIAAGVVTFKAAPDFENPVDGDANNTYVINVIASDGINLVNQDVTITVTNVDDTDPVFTSATAVDFAENGTGTAYSIAATDANVLTYSLGTGNDEGLFNINAGVITFKSAPDFECPADANTDNGYVINVIASDGSNAANQDVTITVTNVDETPEFLSDAVTSIDDNQDYSYNIRVSDQEGDNLTVTATTKPDWLNLTLDEPLSVSTIAGSGELDGQGTGVSKDGIGTDAAFGSTGAIVTDASGNIYMTDLVAGGIRKIDQNAVVTTIAGNTTYEHKDGSGTNASFSGLNDIALGPQGNLYITSGNSIRKMTPEGVVSTLAGTSDGSTGYMDGTGSEARFSALSGITYDAATNALYVTDVRNARIRKVTLDGVVTTFAGSGTVGNDDGTASAASFNNPQDIVVDSKGDFYVADTQSRRVRKITASGMVSTFAGSSLGFQDGKGTAAQFAYFTGLTIDNEDILYVADAENNRIRRISPEGVVSTLLGGEQGYVDGDINVARLLRPQYLAVDADQNLILSEWSLRLRRVKIDRGNQLQGSPLGQKGIFNVILSLTDGANDPVTQTFTITVNDATKPVFTSTETAAFAENGTGTAYTALATDTNPVTYSLGSGNDESLFNVDGTSGAVTFKISPDFENPTDGDVNNTYIINVIASDGINSVNQEVTITVTNVDDTDPVFTSATAVDFTENGTGTAYTVTATDANTLTYSLGTGNDEALFDIAAGAVTFKSAPDFENPADGDANNTYVINVIASDGINAVNQDVTITVTNVDDTDPVFTSATAVDFAENGTGTAYNVTATDANALTYSLGTGNDESLFDIVAGAVTFKTSPDFENPVDGDANNTYVINVIASDGINSVNQDVTITVTNVDDTDPVFTSGTAIDFAENGTGTAYTVAATDANTLTYSLGTGNDEALFDIAAGAVTFKTSPDFENPADGDANNTYLISVIASDGINAVNQDVTITVTDVDEIAPSVSITSVTSSVTSGVFTITVAYSEVVTGFELADISVTNGTAGNFTSITAGKEWTADVTPTSDGAVTVNVAAATATDGTGNANTAATAFSILNDETAPTVVLSSGEAIAGVYTVTAQFSETVTGFALEDVTVADGTAGDFTAVDGDTYTFSLSSTNASATVDIAAAVTTDAADNGNTAANQLMLSFNNTPTDISLSATSIDENNESGDLIGDFSTTDADASDSHIYSLASGAGDTDNASFTLEGTSLKAAEAFDFETQSSYSIRVKTDDGRGGTFEKSFTIRINNVGEPKIELSGEVNFAETQLGIRVSKAITITNIGEVAVEVVIANAPADFSVTPGSVILMAGESKQVNVNFTPTREATYSGNLIFAYQGQQVSMPVSGIGAIVTGVDDPFIDSSEIRLYPNPASEILNIDLTQVNAAKLDITIINAAGKRVFGVKEYDKKQLSIRVGDYNNGMYIMQFTDGKSVARKKVIIRK